MRNEIIALHYKTEDILRNEGVATAMTHIEGHDIHSFLLLLNDPSNLIHLQGYPGMSTPERAYVTGSLMDTQKWLEIRANWRGSIGNEHAANVSDRPFKFDVTIPNYDANRLAGIIRAGLEARNLLVQNTTLLEENPQLR